MNKLMTAIAVAIALPAAANAQTAPAPAPAPKAEQGHKMMDCKCCKDMAGKDHSGHQMPGGHSGHGTAAGGANAPHAGHQQNQQQ